MAPAVAYKRLDGGHPGPSRSLPIPSLSAGGRAAADADSSSCGAGAVSSASQRPLLMDLERGAGRIEMTSKSGSRLTLPFGTGGASASASPRLSPVRSPAREVRSPALATPNAAVRGAAGLMRWRTRATRARKELIERLFEELVSGEVPELVAALLRGDADLLPKGGEALRRCRAHLQEAVRGFREFAAQREGSRMPGHVELQKALEGQCGEMGREELLTAYTALMQEVLAYPLHIHAPVRYNEDSRPRLASLSWASAGAMESHHTRQVFEVTNVLLTGANLLHVAIDRDAALLRDGRPPELTRRVLEAHADVNAPAYYETEAPDPREPGKRLRTAVSAIHLAVDRDSKQLVDLLLTYGASPESRAVFDMRADYTPLHMAAHRGFEDLANLLIERGANAAETDLSGRCPRQVAARELRLKPPLACSVISEEVEDLATNQPSSASQETITFRRNKTAGSDISLQASHGSSGVKSTVGDGKPAVAADVLFQECVDALLAFQSGMRLISSSDPEEDTVELQRCIRHALHGGDINDVYPSPLPAGRHYKGSKRLLKGCLLHFAVDRAVKIEIDGEEENPQAVVELILQASADVHARAHYKTWDVPHTCTAVHIAAAGGAARVLGLLLDWKASVEAMVTNAAKPHYTPLLDATSEGHQNVCQLLLARRANPNVPNRLGRTCLHNAVLDGKGSLACLLTQHGSDVTLADSIFRETPLLCTVRAKEKYQISDMMCLCRAYHDSRSSLLSDLGTLAVCRDKLSYNLLNYVLENLACQENAPLRHRKASDDKIHITMKKEHLLRQVRRVAVEGRPDERGVTPVEHMATILDAAPRTGVRLLADVLMVRPDVQDATHGTLPVYANLRTGRNSWLPWRRWFGTVEPLLSEYQPDVCRRREDGRDWPCWLFDSAKAQAQPAWHRQFAHMDGKKHKKGNHMVQMKVLLLANVLDARILHAIANSWDLEIFGELPVRAIISYMYFHFLKNVILMENLLEGSLLLALLAWPGLEEDQHQLHRFCWTWCAAVPVQDVVVLAWKMYFHRLHGWGYTAFFSCLNNGFGAFLAGWQWVLMAYTAADNGAVELEHFRALVGTVIILRALKLIMSFRYGDMFGTGIIAAYKTLPGVFTMLCIMVSCFAAFATAYHVIKEPSPEEGPGVLVVVYTGLILGADESLGKISSAGELGRSLMIFGTAVFTVYLLNIMIAVLTAEYYKADHNAPLELWRERAHKAAQDLIGPIFPWCTSRVPKSSTDGDSARSPAGNANSETEPRQDSNARRIRFLGDVAVAVLVAAAVVLFFVTRLHAIFSAVCLGLALVLVRSRLLRSESWGHERLGKRFYLWVCHRAADNAHFSLGSEESEEDQLQGLKGKMDQMETMLTELHRRILSWPQAGLQVGSPAPSPRASSTAMLRVPR